VEALVVAEPVGELQLKGFARPIPAVNVVGYKSPGERVDSAPQLATTAADS
jgi:hypothetical protein